jgi:hypothetical protein
MKIFIAFFLLFCFNKSLFCQTDLTGKYAFRKKVVFYATNENKPNKNEINQGANGALILYKIDTNQYKFWLNVSRGWPSFNYGELDGMINVKNNKALFVNKIAFEQENCGIQFNFLKNMIEVKEIDTAHNCGFGAFVYADGKYKKQTVGKIKNTDLKRLYSFSNYYLVTANTIALFASADSSTLKKEYFIKGDKILGISNYNNFIYTEYITPSGKFVYGWLPQSQLSKIKNK